ncbi:hypothetical protein ILUMI_10773 [Ignelater luminosus]|uniref:Lipase domain-containing protein n=1 Tax=Ignelater luminosus TaxID=2038154 RepID=A0A8K0CXH4_IGNLU|nr:hypothetical protein ILUMI_10773 [Ignelater luminosus]
MRVSPLFAAVIAVPSTAVTNLFLSIVSSAQQSGLFGLSPGALVGELPVPIARDILTILVDGGVNLVGNCTNSSNTPLVQFWLFRNPNPGNYIVINSINDIDILKSTIILIHGWGGNGDIGYIHVIKEAYLVRYPDCNIISVDYSVYANGTYQNAYCYAPSVAAVVAQFICNLTSAGINPADLHVVGHSLGAQVAGMAGDNTQKQCNALIGRVTGLDPAGPGYQTINNTGRITKDSGNFVDIIHTNQAQCGYIGDCGDVDFYPNCGYYQPHCLESVIGTVTISTNISHVPLSLVSCSHQRSCYLFAVSINYNNFFSRSCLDCITAECLYEPSVAPIFTSSSTYMGESCRSKPLDSEYLLYTSGTYPYYLGPPGPLN